ncbi:MAG: formylglycine-generating enzyme family protein, partial [Planctomycetes bacterium]|nr:formylglycine-generating enzyme family protein [Planctomycetota bacterium]
PPPRARSLDPGIFSMKWFIVVFILFRSLLVPEMVQSPPDQDRIIVSLIDALSADTWDEREEAFFQLQLFGEKAVPYLETATARADFQTRLKLDYLLEHIPVFQEEIPIQGGVVRIGTDLSECLNPLRECVLKPFSIDRYEVTNFMYYVFLKATGHPAPREWSQKRYPVGGGNLPVTGVGYSDAQAYAEWAGKRLPSAEEWEFAARGSQEFLLPWGDDAFSGAANIDNMKTFGKSAVGTYPIDESPLGCMDMAGNVSEWVTDLSNGDASPAIKGSAFNKTWRKPFYYVCFRAVPKKASYRSRDTGFRCAR